MPQAPHDPNWPPSSFPAWSKCSHFEGGSGDSANAKAGDKLHDLLKNELMELKPPMSPSDKEFVGKAVAVVRELESEHGPGEYEEGIMGTVCGIVTRGTPDVCMDLDDLVIYDLKSGLANKDTRSTYKFQLAVYALLKSGPHAPPFKKARLVVHWPRMRPERSIQVEEETLGEWARQVGDIIDRRRNKHSEPKEPNYWCKYCKLGAKCVPYQKSIGQQASKDRPTRTVTLDPQSINPDSGTPSAVVMMTNGELQNEYIAFKKMKDMQGLVHQEILRRHEQGITFDKIRVAASKGRDKVVPPTVQALMTALNLILPPDETSTIAFPMETLIPSPKELIDAVSRASIQTRSEIEQNLRHNGVIKTSKGATRITIKDTDT